MVEAHSSEEECTAARSCSVDSNGWAVYPHDIRPTPPSRPTAARRPPTPGGICNPTGPGPARSVRARSTPPAPAAAPNPARPGGIRLQPAHRVTRSLRPTLPTRPRPPEPDAMWDGCRAQHEPIMPTPCLSARLPPDHTTSARADRPTVKPAHLHPPSASSDLHLTP